MCMCMCMCMCICVCVCVYVYVYVYMCMCMCMYVNIYTQEFHGLRSTTLKQPGESEPLEATKASRGSPFRSDSLVDAAS